MAYYNYKNYFHLESNLKRNGFEVFWNNRCLIIKLNIKMVFEEVILKNAILKL